MHNIMLKKDMIKRIVRENNTLWDKVKKAEEEYGVGSTEALKAHERWGAVFILTVSLHLGKELD